MAPQPDLRSAADAMTRIWSWPGAAEAETSTPSARSSTAVGALVYSICGRSGIAGPDREDVAQQIMLDAFRALPRYRGTSRLSTWIYSLALRRVADHFRSPQRRDVPSGSPGDDTFPPSPATPRRAGPR